MTRIRTITACVVVGLALATSACNDSPSQTANAADDPPPEKAAMTITSTAFANGQAIPQKYTGEGEDVSPPLAWSNPPEGVRQLALICDDSDAPSGDWVHWVIYMIPANAAGLPEAIPPGERPATPTGSAQGVNSWPGRILGYKGPLPPPGRTHHYHFKLFALEVVLDLAPGLDKAALLVAMEGHILAKAELVGTYER